VRTIGHASRNSFEEVPRGTSDVGLCDLQSEYLDKAWWEVGPLGDSHPVVSLRLTMAIELVQERRRGMSWCRYRAVLGDVLKGASQKERNAIMHALNGNINVTSVLWQGLRLLFGSSSEIRLPFPTEGGTAGVTIKIDTQPVNETLTDITEDDEFMTELDTRTENRALLLATFGSKCLMRCAAPQCEGTVPRLSRMHDGVQRYDDTSSFLVSDFLLASAPWCCRHWSDVCRHYLRTFGIEEGNEYEVSVPLIEQRPLPFSGCLHDPHELVEYALTSSDSLGPQRDWFTSQHRPLLTLGGHRCPKCWPDSCHEWSPYLIEEARGRPRPSGHALQVLVLGLKARMFVDARRYIRKPIWTAASGDPTLQESRDVICITAGNEPALPESWMRLAVSQYWAGRGLGLARLVAAAVMPLDKLVYVMNGEGNFFMQAHKDIFPLRPGLFSYGGEIGHLVLFTAKLDPGCWHLFVDYSAETLGRMKDFYGIDEVVIDEFTCAHVYSGPRPIIAAVSATRNTGRPLILVRADLTVRKSVKVVQVRSLIALALRRLNTGSHKPVPVVLKDEPGPIVHLRRDGLFTLMREYERGHYGETNASQIVVFVRYGTRGDMTPVQPYMTMLSKWGFTVIDAQLTSIEEGQVLLDCAERGDLLDALKIMVNIQNGLVNLPFTVIAPFTLPGPWLKYCCSAPLEHLEPVYGEPSTAAYVAASSLYMDERTIFVGAWDKLNAVPRSTDGVVFDTYLGPSPGTGSVFVPGSSGEVPSIPGVPTLEPGNHMQHLRRYATAYVLGAGTAQTAAAAGLKVVGVGRKLDRSFRRPDNVQAGMKFGRPPEVFMAHLALFRDELFWPIWGKMDVHIKWWTLKIWAHHLAYSSARYIIVLPFFVKMAASVPLPTPSSALSLMTMFDAAGSNADRVLKAIAMLAVLYPVHTMFEMDVFSWLKVVAWCIKYTTGSPIGCLVWFTTDSLVQALVITVIMEYVLFPYAISVIDVFWQARDDCAQLEVQFFWLSIFPAVHVKFMSPDGWQQAEGEYGRTVGGFVPYRWGVGPAVSTTRWFIRLRTGVQWREVSRPVHVHGTYGPFHNCQTALLLATGPNISKLGLGLLFMAPFLFMMWTGLCVVALLGFFAAFTTPVLAAIPRLRLSWGASTITLLADVANRTSLAFFAPGLNLYQRVYVSAIYASTAYATNDDRNPKWLYDLIGNTPPLQTENAREEWLVRAAADGPGIALSRISARHLLAVDAAVRSLSDTPGRETTISEAALEQALNGRHATAEQYMELRQLAMVSAEGGTTDDLIQALPVRLLMAVIEKVEEENTYADVFDGFLDEPWGDASPECLAFAPQGRLQQVIHKWAFFLMREDEFDEQDSPESTALFEEELGRVAEGIAATVRAGASFDSAIDAGVAEFAAYEHVQSLSSAAYDQTLDLFGKVSALRVKYGTKVDQSLLWFFAARKWAHDHGMIFLFPLDLAYLVIAKLVGDVSRLLGSTVTLFTNLAETVMADPNSNIAMRVTLWLASILDVLDIRHRTSLKPAWALLLGRMRWRLNRGDYMMATVHGARMVPSDSYGHWADRMKELMVNSVVDVSPFWSQPPSRPVRMPMSTFGIEAYDEFREYFSPRIIETPRERIMLETAIRHGASPGIDKSWESSPDNIGLSLSRYTVARPQPSVAAHAAIISAADALFNQFPEMYEAPRGLTVKNVIAATQWKFSPGLPFIPVVKKRKDLRDSAWVNAIQAGVTALLERDDMPEMAFHCFGKEQVVRLSKELRTVTAGDRLHALAFNCLALERNKRTPPQRALVLPATQRTEGGMQHVYKALATQPHLFLTDGRAFDSTVCSEVVVEAPVRLWERGIAGNWGDSGTTAWMRAYYEGISQGILVNLGDGSVIRKTGGGGTGSPATSSDNSTWLRVSFIASWSLAFGLPALEFFDHVVLANAADDTVVSVDDMTKNGMVKWATVMREEYGTDFTFIPGVVGDGVLHLKLLMPHEVDHHSYVQIGRTPGEFAVMHDPAQLFLRRSEYRATRMDSSFFKQYDYIANRSVGHAYLTAHNRAAYDDIANDWQDAASSFLHGYFRDVTATRVIAQNGHVEHIMLNLGTLPSQRLLRVCERMPGPLRNAAVQKHMTLARKWLRAHQLPSYLKVFETWTRPATTAALDKRYSKIPQSTFAMPFIDGLRTFTIDTISALRMIPKALRDIGGEPDTLPLTRSGVGSDSIIEAFIYHKVYIETGTAPTAQEMVGLCRQAPFGSVLDPFVFASRRHIYASYDDGQRGALAFKVLLMKLVYTVIDVIVRWASELRWLGTFIIIFFFMTREIDVVYSVLSLTYWLGHGRASLAISNLTSKDPYLMYKWITIALVTALPLPERMPFFFWRLTEWVAIPVELTTTLYQAKTYLPGSVKAVLALPLTPFARVAMIFMDQVEDERRHGQLLVAGMASGKSTVFMAELVHSPSFTRGFLLMPSNLLVSMYDNSFLREHVVVKHSAESLDLADINTWDPVTTPKVLHVMTHGLFVRHAADLLRRANAPPLEKEGQIIFDPDDVVVVDEVGGSNLDTVHVCSFLSNQSRGLRWLGMTGTPSGPAIQLLHGYRHEVEARNTGFKRDIVTMDDAQLQGTPIRAVWSQQLSLARSKWPDLRMLIVEPSEHLCQVLAESIQTNWAQGASVISRRFLEAPTSGHIVATTIVDVGVNIEPPPGLMVDMGLTKSMVFRGTEHRDALGRVLEPRHGDALAREPYSLATVFTSPDIAAQRHARVGRTSDGIVLAHPGAGKGEIARVVPSILDIAAMFPSVRATFCEALDCHYPVAFTDAPCTLLSVYGWNERWFTRNAVFEPFRLELICILTVMYSLRSWESTYELYLHRQSWLANIDVVKIVQQYPQHSVRQMPINMLDFSYWKNAFILRTPGEGQRRGAMLWFDPEASKWFAV